MFTGDPSKTAGIRFPVSVKAGPTRETPLKHLAEKEIMLFSLIFEDGMWSLANTFQNIFSNPRDPSKIPLHCIIHIDITIKAYRWAYKILIINTYVSVLNRILCFASLLTSKIKGTKVNDY